MCDRKRGCWIVNNLHEDINLDDVKISVIVPAFNREKTIKRCIDSIVNQTIPPFEVIVVDDGSVDKTVEILENIACSYLRVIKQNHKGAQAARNLGIMNAKGNYIAFLDSDDEWCPQMVEKATAYLLRAGEDSVIYSNCYVCSNGKKKLWKLPDCGNNAYPFLLLHQGPTISMLAKKEVFLKIGLLDEDVVAYQEWDTAIRLAEKVKFTHIHEPLFVYHLHNGETISKDKDKDVKGYAYIVRKHQKKIIEIHRLKGLNTHYKNLMKKCWGYSNKWIFTFAIEIIYVNIMYMINGLRKKNRGK